MTSNRRDSIRIDEVSKLSKGRLMLKRLVCGVLQLLALFSLSGCGASGVGGAGEVVLAKELVPDEVARRALEMYDANSDGKIDGDELEKCVALQAALPRIDKNRDGALASDEIATRIGEYQTQSDLLPLSIVIESKRRPLSNAQVVFVPEAFMADGLQSYQGVSDASGVVSLQGEQVEIPGLPVGLYRVKITSQDGTVKTEKGCEVAEDNQVGNRLVFSL